MSQVGSGFTVSGFIGRTGASEVKQCYSSFNTIKVVGGGGMDNVVGFVNSRGDSGGSWILRDCYVRNTIVADGLNPASGFCSSFRMGNTTPDRIYSASKFTNATYDKQWSMMNDAPWNGSTFKSYVDNDLAAPLGSIPHYLSAAPYHYTYGYMKTTPEMKIQSTYDGWDFTTIWDIDPAVNDGYPFLRGIVNDITPLIVPIYVVVETVKETIVNNVFQSLYRSNGTDSLNDNFFETVETDLGNPNMVKWVNRIFVDYEEEGKIIIYQDGIPVEFTLRRTAKELLSGPRGVTMFYMKLKDRIPFSKIKVKCMTSNGLKIYSILIDIDTANYENKVLDYKEDIPQWPI